MSVVSRKNRPAIVRVEMLVLPLLILMVYANIIRLGGAQITSHVITPATVYAASEADTSKRISPPAVPTASTSTQNDSALPVSATAQKATITTPRACTGNSYQLPSPLPISSLPTGLNVVADSALYYQIYGASVPELRNAIESCPLRSSAGSFHAVTAYQLSWSYSQSIVNGTCRLSDVRVGLHINQFLPMFVPSPDTPISVATSWNVYATNLKIHEDGHAAIDRDHANRLTVALQNLQALDCKSLGAQTQTTISSYVTMLNTANVLYDSQTNHGANQGAVL